ncbi:MAG: CoA-binding protein [Myxococcales bacterium]|nr:CoA-binding protein [Myxococcales bacterium]
MDWRDHLIERAEDVRRVAGEAQRVAVLGIKPDSHGYAPAHYVPRYLKEAGVEVIPVPVYYPEITEILGAPVLRRVAEVEGPIDIVDVFRRSADVAAHLDDLLAAKPKAVWLQSGIRDDATAEALARAGIDVVQDRCLMVEHRLARRRY